MFLFFQKPLYNTNYYAYKMLNKQEFNKIRQELKKYDAQRELLIKKAREVLKLSKRLIYSVHRNDLREANALFKEVKKKKQDIDKTAKKHKKLAYEGSYSEAMQEYAEAMCYYSFINKNKIPSIKEIGVNTNDYLLGICDLTGELVRKAVSLAVKRRYKEVEKIKKIIEEIYNEFLKFDLRNSYLRKKSDSIKYNLKKIEEVVYDARKK